MFLIYFNKFLFILYLFVFLTSCILNFYTIKNLNIRYIEQQNKYSELASKLSENISIEIENTHEEITNIEQTYISNFSTDVDQLTKRGERILLNMHQASLDKYNFYISKRENCIELVKNLIDSILSNTSK